MSSYKAIQSLLLGVKAAVMRDAVLREIFVGRVAVVVTPDAPANMLPISFQLPLLLISFAEMRELTWQKGFLDYITMFDVDLTIINENFSDNQEAVLVGSLAKRGIVEMTMTVFDRMRDNMLVTDLDENKGPQVFDARPSFIGRPEFVAYTEDREVVRQLIRMTYHVEVQFERL